MSASHSYTISIPQLKWNSRLTWLSCGVCLIGSLFCFWFFLIRPYVWVEGGQIVARSCILASDLAGRIVEIGPLEGTKVAKGTLLFALDTDLLQEELRQLEFHQKILDDQIRMGQKEIQQIMQDYLGAAHRSELGLEGDEAVKRSFALLEEAQSNLQSKEAARAARDAEKNRLLLQIEKRKVVAPFDGIIAKQMADVGTVLSFGDPVISFYNPEPMWIEVPIPEKHLGQIAIGDPVRIEVAAFAGKQWPGKVAGLSAAKTEKGFVARVSLENTPSFWIPGLSARAQFKVR